MPGSGEAAGPVERGQPGDRLAAGDAVAGVAVADARPVVGLLRHGDAAEPDQRFVDHRRPEDAVPVEGDVVERLVVAGREHQRHRLDVAPVFIRRERVAAEELVVGRPAPVDAGVALVGANAEQGLADVVAGNAAGNVAIRQRIVRGVAQQRPRRCAKALDRNPVAGERLAGLRIDDRRGLRSTGRPRRQAAGATEAVPNPGASWREP